MKKKKFIKPFFTVVTALLFSFNCTDWDLGDESPPEPVVLEIIDATDTSVTLRWTQSHDEYFRSYKIYYSSTSDIVDTTDKISDTLFFSHDTVKTVRNLDSDKLYYFRVIVTTHNDLISASNIVDTTTLKDMSSRILTLFKPEDIKEFSIKLHWEKAWVSDYNQYWIYCDTNSTVDSGDLCVDTVNDGTTSVIDGLKRNTTYWFRVYLNQENVASAGSNIDSATTLDGRPEAVSLSIDQSSITDTSLTLIWSKSPDEDFRRYIVYFDTVKSVDTFSMLDTADINVYAVDWINDTVLTLMSLERANTYWFNVYVEDTSGFLSSSNTDSASTDDGFPDAVAVEKLKATDTTITLKWSKNEGSDFSGYEVYFDNNSDVDSSDSLILYYNSRDDTSCIVTGLQPFTQYWFVVYVKNSSGIKTESNTVVNFSVVLKMDSSLVSITDSSVMLWWTLSLFPDSVFKSYKIFRSLHPDVDNSGAEIVNINNIEQQTYLDIGLDSASIYYYKLYQYFINEKGLIDYDESNEIMVQTLE